MVRRSEVTTLFEALARTSVWSGQNPLIPCLQLDDDERVCICVIYVPSPGRYRVAYRIFLSMIHVLTLPNHSAKDLRNKASIPLEISAQ